MAVRHDTTVLIQLLYFSLILTPIVPYSSLSLLTLFHLFTLILPSFIVYGCSICSTIYVALDVLVGSFFGILLDMTDVYALRVLWGSELL
jgi:uncharacterized membrane protein (DUF4010 family)